MTMPLPMMVGMNTRVYAYLKGKPKRNSIYGKVANMRSEEEVRQMIDHLGIVSARLDYIEGEADRVVEFGIDMLKWVLGIDEDEGDVCDDGPIESAPSVEVMPPRAPFFIQCPTNKEALE